jgi:hypothetical protein
MSEDDPKAPKTGREYHITHADTVSAIDGYGAAIAKAAESIGFPSSLQPSAPTELAACQDQLRALIPALQEYLIQNQPDAVDEMAIREHEVNLARFRLLMDTHRVLHDLALHQASEKQQEELRATTQKQGAAMVWLTILVAIATAVQAVSAVLSLWK